MLEKRTIAFFQLKFKGANLVKRSLASILLSCLLLATAAGCNNNQSGASSSSTSASEGASSSEAASSTTESTDATVIETDIVVVGGGGTGLVAALSAAEQGKKVVVLEKMGYLGGATGMSAGKVPAAGTKQQEALNIVDTPQALSTDILRPGNYSQRKDLVEMVANNSKSFIEWSETKGIAWDLETSILYYGQTVYRMHVAPEGGAGIIKALSAEIEKNNNITVMLDTAGTGLVTNDNGDVVGVTATNKAQGDLVVKGRAVVLATSGFGANREMVEKYVPSIANAYPLVAPGATGEGILWAQAIGAEVRNMSAYQGYAPISFETKKSLGQTMLDKGGILVNSDSRRFLDERTGYSNLAAAIVNQKDAYAWMIFDAKIANAQETTINAWKEAGILIQGNTVEELASATGLNAATLQTELDRYQEGIANGEDYLNRTSLPQSFEAPYYAVKVTGDFRHTQGGLVIDLNNRVLKNDGSAIPGLYAGGGVTEGFSSTGGPGYMSGNGLLQALVLGKLAGEQASAY